MEREQLTATVTAAQNGDSEALSLLFHTYYNDVYYFALKTLKDADLACDITQETFVEIINTIGDLKAPAAFVTWMRQVTYHQCTRYFKKKKEVLVEEDEDGITVFDTLEEEREEFIPGEGVDKEDFRATILSLLDTLSEEQRSAVIMHYYHEMSIKEIAETQEVSEGTVKSRLNYARKALKKSVEDYEKKHDVKLHCAGVLPLLLWLFANAGKEAMPMAAVETVAGGIASATGISIAVSSGGGVATATATTVAGTGLMAKIAALPLVTKTVAGVVAVSIVAGSVGMAISNQKKPEESTPLATTAPATAPVTDPIDADMEKWYVVPEGCSYILFDGTIFSEGQEVTAAASQGDQLISADYTYSYQTAVEGWNVKARDNTKSSYSEFYGWINGAPLKDLGAVFYYCTELVRSPAIPDTVTNMSGAYKNCVKLKEAPEIPAGVTNLSEAFQWTALRVAPKLPEGLQVLSKTFMGCGELEYAPEIPAGVKSMDWAFGHCDSLKRVPNLPEGVTDLRYAFFNCEALESIPAIPASVTDLYGAFENCTSLTGTIEINSGMIPPEGISKCQGSCPECNGVDVFCMDCEVCSPLGSCFYDTQKPIVLTGSCGALNELAATGNNGNVTVWNQSKRFVIPTGCRYVMANGTVLTAGELMPETVSDGDEFITADYTYKYGYAWRISGFAVGPPPSYWEDTDDEGWSFGANVRTKTSYEPVEAFINGAPVISASYAYYGCSNMTTAPLLPDGITNLSGVFSECYSLTQVPRIPATAKDLSYGFEGCSAMVTAPVLPDGVTILEKTFVACRSLQVVPNIPQSVVDMEYAFEDCTSLQSVPKIPARVLMMNGTFSGCSALTGVIEIDASPYTYAQCFAGTVQEIILSGTSTVLEQLSATGENGNVKTA